MTAQRPILKHDLGDDFAALWQRFGEARALACGVDRAVARLVREHRFHATRRWRFDAAWPIARVAVELEGGLYTRGRHLRASGYDADCEKYNAAALAGWRVLRYTRRSLDRRTLQVLDEVAAMLALASRTTDGEIACPST